MDFIFLLFGFLIGIIVGYSFFIIKTKNIAQDDNLLEELEKLNSEVISATERNKMLNSLLEEEKKNLENERIKSNDYMSKLSATETALSVLKDKLKEQQEEFNKVKENMKLEFENLANSILEEKSKRFTELNKSNLEQVLGELGEKIKSFENKVDKAYTDDVKDRSALMQQVKQLQELNMKISEEANNLTKALKGDSKTQGTWGEFILESILEKSGLLKGREYTVQESLTDEEKGRQRPDVIIYLPDNRNIIIDSKVSLKAYESYCSSDDENSSKIFLKNHISSIRTHIKELSSKQYENITKLNTPDFVLLFMPVEPALSLAVQYDNSLWMEAFEKNIIIVSPSTLLATLRTISNIWKQEYRNKNALEIAEQSGRMLDKFAGFLNDLDDVGKKLNSAKESYDKALNKLSTGKGNLINQAEKIKLLGAKSTKSIPQNFLDSADED